eukprot:COSAG05_NODE_2836_length_2584_cov_4.343272_4_plen_34_part_01
MHYTFTRISIAVGSCGTIAFEIGKNYGLRKQPIS